MFSLNPLYFIIPAQGDSERREPMPVKQISSGDRPKELFSPYDALMGGNAFKDEYRGYKNYRPGLPKPTDERQKCLIDMMAVAMIAHDIGLYLDVYPDDRKMIAEFEKCSREYMEKKKAYEDRYGPLKQACGREKNGMFDYLGVPSPWTRF